MIECGVLLNATYAQQTDEASCNALVATGAVPWPGVLSDKVSDEFSETEFALLAKKSSAGMSGVTYCRRLESMISLIYHAVSDTLRHRAGTSLWQMVGARQVQVAKLTQRHVEDFVAAHFRNDEKRKR